ncbi:MAG: ROK family protein [Dehalococcoidia bacterium]|nr:ROK family protein [Dehalococcoidia bacterium]
MPNEPDPILVVDLGGTRLRTAVLDPYGGLLHRTSMSTPRDRPEALAAAILDTLDSSRFHIAGAVIGIAGPISYAEGHPIRLPNLPQWDGFVSAEGLARVVGLPVTLANDADLAALGEHRFGAGRGTSDMVYVTVSTGVGAGVILNGRLLHGQRSGAEIGLTIIDLESGALVEELGSGTALEQMTGLSGAQVTLRAAQGDPTAIAAFGRIGRVVGTALYNLARLYAPQRIVVGGGVAQAGVHLLNPVREFLRDHGEHVEVVASALGDDSGLRGGVAFWNDLQEAPPGRAPFLGLPG